jgi:hypothetical protein
LSEPPQRHADLRLSSAHGFTNPILRIEELGRFPATSSRVPAPGTALVFRSRGGRLRVPAGGYTAGELFWFGPRLLYQVDTSPHPFVLTFADDDDLVEVVGEWRVDDPRAVVSHRVSDLEPVVVAAVRRRLGAEQRLPCGVRLSGLCAVTVPAVRPLGPAAVRFLAGDDEDDDPVDARRLVAELRAIAERGRAAHDGAEGPVRAALDRLHELVTRLASAAEQAGDVPDR